MCWNFDEETLNPTPVEQEVPETQEDGCPETEAVLVG